MFPASGSLMPNDGISILAGFVVWNTLVSNIEVGIDSAAFQTSS
jgi:hypothetical protein